jgi:WD40 repeat protein
MKTILLFLITIIALFLLFIIPLQAQEELPDTVWTKKLDNINAVKFSPDAKYIIASTHTHGVYQLDRTNGDIIRTIMLGNNGVDFSPTGDTLILSAGNQVTLLNTETGVILDTFLFSKEGNPNCEAIITPDGKRIIATTGKMGFDEPQILVIDIATKEIIKTFIGRYYKASRLDISSDGKYFIFNDFRGTYYTVILMDLHTYEELKIFEKPGGSYSNHGFAPNNEYFLTSSSSGLDLWNLKTFKVQKTLNYYQDINATDPGASSRVFTNDSKYLIYGYFDWEDYDPNKVIVWNIEGDSLQYEYPFSGSKDIDISKDDYIAASGYTPYLLGHLNLLRPKWNETSVDENEENDFKYILKDKILTIKFDDELNITPTINIYDISGKLVKSISDFELQTDFKSINVNVDFLIPGVYLIEIITTKKHYSFKLMIP